MFFSISILSLITSYLILSNLVPLQLLHWLFFRFLTVCSCFSYLHSTLPVHIS
jgi:hypothetical protein